MLNEEKIRLMADLAVFEKKNGGRMQAVTSYFKSDYISRNMIRGFISYTLCCVMILAIWVLFNMDVFLSTIGIDALTGLAWRGGLPCGACSVYGANLRYLRQTIRLSG